MDAAPVRVAAVTTSLPLLAESVSDVVVGTVGSPVIYESYDGPGVDHYPTTFAHAKVEGFFVPRFFASGLNIVSRIPTTPT